MTDSSSWKLIKLRSFVPIRSHVHRNCAVVIKLAQHDRFVTDKCRLRLTEKNRRKYGFYIKPVKDFRKLKRQNIRVEFRPIRSTPGLCGFWKGYKLPSIKVRIILRIRYYSVNRPTRKKETECSSQESSPRPSDYYSALPLSYRKLVGAKAVKLGPWDKHSAFC